MWNSQFDHPYDGAYCEAWNDLPSEDRKALLLMAARSNDRHSMFTPSLIAALASFADPTVGPVIARWADVAFQRGCSPEKVFGIQMVMKRNARPCAGLRSALSMASQLSKACWPGANFYIG